jgi:branched-chain amino acid transport system permease protein
MVNLELKRDRIQLRWGDAKYEYVLEPRYWRNPALSVLFLMLLPLLVYNRPSLLTMITTANLLAAITIPLSLQILGTARLNFGPQLYLGLGGYTAALLNLHLGWNPVLTLAAAVLVCLIVSLALSPITWIAKGLYFSLITLILPLAFLDLTYIYGDLFRGEVGLMGMSALVNLGKVKLNYMTYYYLSLLLMLLYMLTADRIARSRFGFALAAINENEDVARMMGVNVNLYKVFYYVFPSVLIGVVGWFIVHTFRTFAGVTYLPLEFMLKVLIIVLVGGRAFVYGAVPGAYFMAILEELLREFGGSFHYVLFPVALMVAILVLPRGEGLYGLFHRRHHRDYFPVLRVRRD